MIVDISNNIWLIGYLIAIVIITIVLSVYLYMVIKRRNAKNK